MIRIQTAFVFLAPLGRPLDIFHGVDGWLEFVPERGSPVIVTVDVTMDAEKLSHKADVIVQQFPDPEEDERAFLRAVEDYASEVADQLRPAVDAMLDRWEKRAS